MKKLFKSSLTIILGLSLIITACKKEDSSNGSGGNNTGSSISNEQKSTVFYFGGTWSANSGSFGKPAKEQIKTAVGAKANIISCQLNSTTKDSMNCIEADSLALLFNITQISNTYVGGADTTFFGFLGSATSGTSIISFINAQTAKTAKANCALTLKENDGLLSVTANGQFFNDATGEYLISCYLLEDKLKYIQTSDASAEKNIHYGVLRAKSGNLLGTTIATNPKSGDKFTKEFTSFFIEPRFVKANMAVVVIIWKRTSTGRVICNSSYAHL